MNTHHTPGPWIFGKASDAIITKNGTMISDMVPSRDNLDDETVEANARLIAAAPELLEIVRQIAESKDYSELHMDEIGQQARAVIAKATQP